MCIIFTVFQLYTVSLSSLRFAFLFASIFVSSFCFFFVFSVSLVLLFFNVSIKTCEPNENPYHVTILLSSCLTSVRTFFQIGFYTVIWNSMVMLLPFLLFIRRVLLTSFSFSLFYLTFCCALLCSFGFCSVHAVFFFAHIDSVRFASLDFICICVCFWRIIWIIWCEMSWDAVLSWGWVCASSISHVQVFIDEGGGTGVAWQQLVRCVDHCAVRCASVCLAKALEAFFGFQFSTSRMIIANHKRFVILGSHKRHIQFTAAKWGYNLCLGLRIAHPLDHQRPIRTYRK